MTITGVWLHGMNQKYVNDDYHWCMAPWNEYIYIYQKYGKII